MPDLVVWFGIYVQQSWVRIPSRSIYVKHACQL